MTSFNEQNQQTCLNCNECIMYDKYLVICDKKTSEHYCHVLSKKHPSCSVFFDSDTIAEIIGQETNT